MPDFGRECTGAGVSHVKRASGTSSRSSLYTKLSVRCGGSELRHDRFAVHPVEHVDNKRIPVLETRVEDRFAVRGLIIFVQYARTFVIPSEQGDGLRRQFPRLRFESVFDQSAPCQVIRYAPDRAEPCRGVAAGFERVHFFHFRQCAYAVRGIECLFIDEVFAHHAFGLLRSGDIGPHGEKSRPDADALNQAVPRTGRSAVIHLLFGADRTQIEVHAVKEAVALVPAMFLNGGFELLGVPGVFGGEFLPVEASRQILHGAQFLIHHAVEKYRTGTAVGAEISTGIVVHADHHIVLPEVEPRRTVAVAVYVAADEIFQPEELVA